MVPISTYRDERRLFAVIGVVVVAALIALLQISFARQGRPSPITVTVTTGTAYVQLALSVIVDAVRGGVATAIATPQLARKNAELIASNAQLRAENERLAEALARVPAERDIALAQLDHPGGIAATVIGYDPEGTQHVITIDRGARDGVMREAGVVTGAGAVGRITEVSPVSSKVLLIIDPSSKLPAIVAHGRWWAIAIGTQTRLTLQYVSQDAKLHVGDVVVTGEGRSFHAGTTIGRIAKIAATNAGALYQNAVIEPAVAFGALTRVVVLAK